MSITRIIMIQNENALKRKQSIQFIPELNPVDFDAIQRNSEALRKEMAARAKEPWTWEDMVAQYDRLHPSE